MTGARDWMARPLGRFLVWWLYLLAACAVVALVLGMAWVVEWAVTRLTGNTTAAVIVGFVVLFSLVAAFNAWLWSSLGNRYVQALVRVMQRMEGR